MISLSDLGMAFGGQQLYEGVRWQLRAGGHYGLVGANGSGKSTLLRLMSGELTPETDSIVRPSGLRLGTLGQDHFRLDDFRLLDAVLMGHPVLWDALAERERLLRDQAQVLSPGTGERLGELEITIAEQRATTRRRARRRCSPASASSRSGTSGPCASCRAASDCGCCSRRRSSPIPTCCCSTSRRTTSTSHRSSGSRATCATSGAPSLSSPTTATS